MSKINELRRKATEAARKRDWKSAVKLYERVCEIDSANASFRNELGDIYLKMGEVHDALDAFARAAELYRSVGLHNNAVAVLKKVLRHDKNHLDAIWGLGEVREAQGIELEAQQHYIEFLGMADSVDGVNRDKFTNRCVLLVEKYGDDLQMLSRVESVFESWELAEDHARVLMQKASLAHEEGQGELIDKYIEKAREIYEDLDTLDDYIELVAKREDSPAGEGEAEAPQGSEVEPAAEQDEDPAHDVIDVEPDAAAAVADPESADSEDPEMEFEIDDSDLGDFGAGLEFELEDEGEPDPEAKPEVEANIDPNDLSTRIDLSEFDQLVAAGSDSAEAVPDAEPASEAEPPAGEDGSADELEQPVEESVNLLDELLADGSGGFDLAGGDDRQVESIQTDLGDQIASQVAPDDYAGQYDVGVVYMEMGLYEQAAAAFGRASRGDEQRLKALEMQGSCLRRSGRNGEALAAFQDGLNTKGEPVRHFLGLLYEVGICYEEMGNPQAARKAFERAASIDSGFRDVSERLQRLVTPAG